MSEWSLQDLEAMYANVVRHGNENTPAGRALMEQITARRGALLDQQPAPAANNNQGVLHEAQPIDEDSGWEMIRMMDALRGY